MNSGLLGCQTLSVHSAAQWIGVCSREHLAYPVVSITWQLCLIARLILFLDNLHVY